MKHFVFSGGVLVVVVVVVVVVVMVCLINVPIIMRDIGFFT